MVYETRHNPVLAFPKYVWNALTYPVGQLTILAEHKGLFANRSGREAKTFGLLPYGALGGEMGGNLGGETGIAGGFTMFHSNLFGRGNEFSARLIANRSNFSGQARYEDRGIGGGPWYWECVWSKRWIRGTRGPPSTARCVVPGRGSITSSATRGITLGRHSNFGETEGYEPDTIVELRLSHGFRQFDDIGRLPSNIVGANEAINLFSVGGRVAFDDRDFKPPTASISHPLNYQLPGRVLLFAEGLLLQLSRHRLSRARRTRPNRSRLRHRLPRRFGISTTPPKCSDSSRYFTAIEYLPCGPGSTRRRPWETTA